MKTDDKYYIAGKRGVMLLSGGLDSCVMAQLAQIYEWEIHALTVDYGQASRGELVAADAIAHHYGFEHRIIAARIPWAHPLTSFAEHPTRTLEEIRADRGPSPYVVPGRNAILLSLAASWAKVLDIREVFIGATAEDQIGFEDCRPEFFNAASPALGVNIRDPLTNGNKESIAKMAIDLGAPWEKTVSCYYAAPDPCGRCDACMLRAEAIEGALSKRAADVAEL